MLVDPSGSSQVVSPPEIAALAREFSIVGRGGLGLAGRKVGSRLGYSQAAAVRSHQFLFTCEDVAVSQIEKVLYTAKTHTTGGRDGASQSSDGRLDVKLSSPGAVGTGTNPEQLFAAGWSACFLGAMGVAAAEIKVRLPAERAIDAEVDLGTAEGGYLLRARLNI